jgi:NAD(P)H-dependent FMN reductase
LGDRVAKFLLSELKKRSNVTHEIDFVDLLEVRLPLLEQAHHWYAPGTAPKDLEALAQRVSAADCFVLISPEYNHSMSPAMCTFGWSEHRWI